VRGHWMPEGDRELFTHAHPRAPKVCGVHLVVAASRPTQYPPAPRIEAASSESRSTVSLESFDLVETGLPHTSRHVESGFARRRKIDHEETMARESDVRVTGAALWLPWDYGWERYRPPTRTRRRVSPPAARPAGQGE